MNDPIKVLHVVSVDKENYYLNNLVDFSSPDEVEFSFVTFAGECDFGRSLEKRGNRVYYLNALRRSEYPRGFKQLWSILKSEDPDIVHTHLFDASVLGLTAAKLQKRKTVLTRHHSDAVHEIQSPLKRRFYLGLENYISRNSDHIIAPSRMVREYLVDKEGVADEKVTVIPYGQTIERFESITSEQVEDIRIELGMAESLALVCVSRLYDRKGHIYLFQALSDLFKSGLSAKLYLVGAGDHQPVLEKQASELGIAERVKFLGWRNDALAIMKAADMIVHPSLEDALSSAVIESVMLEKPIIATDISGVRDSLGDGRYGKIVPPADAASFRDALQEVLGDMETAKERASKGREYLLEYMDAGRVAREYTSIYQKVNAKV